MDIQLRALPQILRILLNLEYLSKLWIDRVHIVIARVENLIMINLQKARERVSQMDTVWIMMVKLVWNRRKIPQARENSSSCSLE